MNVSATVRISATVGEMSAIVGNVHNSGGNVHNSEEIEYGLGNLRM